MIRMDWTSTYSEQPDSSKILQDEFWLRIYDPCIDNQLTRNAYISDLTYTVEASAATFTPSYSESVATSTCPQTKTCYVWNDSKDTWETQTSPNYRSGCKIGDGLRFFNDFDDNGRGRYKVYISKSDWQTHYSTHPDFMKTYKVKIEIKDPRSAHANNKLDFIFDVTIKYICNSFEITNDSTYIGRQIAIIDKAGH